MKGRVLEDACMSLLVLQRCLWVKGKSLPRGRLFSSEPCIVGGKVWVIR